MDNALTPIAPPRLPSLGLDAAEAVRRFMAGKKPQTIRAYAADLRAFAAWLGVESVADATKQLLHRPHGEANAIASAYQAGMMDAGLAPATVNRRLAVLRSLVKTARTLGLIAWTLEVDGVRAEAYRDTRGCGHDAYHRAYAAIPATDKGTRDRAILRALYSMGLRRGEVVSLDLEHYDAHTRRLWVLGKGKRQREGRTVPPETAKAFGEWLAVRGDEPGALFTNMDRRTKGGRLTDHSIYRIVKAAGERVGEKMRPHGLRHASITRVLDLNGGNVRDAGGFSRHASIETIQRYDDDRRDTFGAMSRLIDSEYPHTG